MKDLLIYTHTYIHFTRVIFFAVYFLLSPATLQVTVRLLALFLFSLTEL